MRFPSFHTNDSFSTRLTYWVVLTSAIIFITIILVIAFFMSVGIISEAKGHGRGVLKNSSLRINNVLYSVEVAIQNNIFEIKNHLKEPEKMYEIAKRIVEQNPTIYGSAIAFEPNYYKEKGKFFSPYAYRNNRNEIDTMQLGTADYEYHYMDWYQIPKLLKTDYWSEPYYDSGGGETIMTTYSYPLEDENGDIFAIVTADVSLEWLTKIITNMKYHEKAYNFVVSRSGTFIVHPDKSKILKETLFTYTAEQPDTLDYRIAYDMLAGSDSMAIIKDEGVRSVLFYAPIKRMGWSIGIICPSVEFFSNGIGALATIAFLMILGLVILSYVCRKVLKRLTKPLSLFAQSADEIAKGNIEVPLPEINTQDEMKTMHDSFEVMQHSLSARIEELKEINEQKGRIQGELQVARNIQLAMIPKQFPAFTDRDDIDVYGMLDPAKAVGGDLYDFYIRDEKLFFCIGDVSGKGVPASLVMAMTRSFFRSISRHESLPYRIVMHINEALSDMNDTMFFVTLIVGALDLPSGRLRYCNAGHCAPLLISKNTGFLPVSSNLPIGIISDFKYEAQETHIDSGTTIFLYTDGLTEAENISHEQYGEDRMFKTADEIRDKQLNAEQTIQGLNDSVRQFVNGAAQSDDLTMLAIRYKKENLEVRLSESLTLPNDIETIPELNMFVDRVCESVGFDMATTASLNLAIEEAVVNVMNYAYPKSLKGLITIRAIANDARLKFIITDSGTPFDPTTKEDADITLSATERPIGGLGIYLVRQIMDSVNYERIDDMNVLTLRKKLSTTNEAIE